MHVSPCTRSVSLVFAAGSVPLLLALSLHGQPAAKAIPSKADSPLAVAQALDAIVQPRFQDDRAGVFGLGRVVPVVRGHLAVNDFQPHTKSETQIWQRANNARRSFQVDFLHCAHVPGKFAAASSLPAAAPGIHLDGTLSPTVVDRPKPSLSPLIQKGFAPAPNWNDPKVREQVGKERVAELAMFQQAAAIALPNLLKGKAQEKTVGGWLVVMRPVCASKDSCLTCHAGAKRGDTLGAMVYAVSNTVNKSESTH